jgi:hypothetical protein
MAAEVRDIHPLRLEEYANVRGIVVRLYLRLLLRGSTQLFGDRFDGRQPLCLCQRHCCILQEYPRTL